MGSWGFSGSTPISFAGGFPGMGSEADLRDQIARDARQFGENAVPTLISKSNLAAKLAADRPEESEKLHREVLAGRIKLLGKKSVPVAISQTGLGRVLKQQGKYEEAIKYLEASLVIREATRGEERNAAITRDELGCCYQALGQREKAREVRVRKGLSEIVCSNEPCSKTAKEKGLEMLNCCARCKAIWYCSPACQKADWKKQHKKICQPPEGTSTGAPMEQDK